MLKLDLTYTNGFLGEEEISNAQSAVNALHDDLQQKRTPGADFLGWLDLASRTLQEGVADILETAKEIREKADALVVVGIGGSYLGARAAYEWVKPEYYNQLSKEQRGGPEIYFLGNHISADAVSDLLTVLKGKQVYVNVISKSGTTTEPAIGFRLIRQWLIEQYGEQETKRRIVATTDASKGALRKLATDEGYKTYVIPDDVGGRYSVLTPVGLLPLAAIGVDIEKLLQGAADAEKEFGSASLSENAAYKYAVLRNALYRKGYVTEIFAHFEPALHYFAEWWKQLYGESEGKDQKGVFPASVGYTTDLHSMGQFVQEGYRNLFETFVHIENGTHNVDVPSAQNMEDGLEYLAGKSLVWVNDKARLATQSAHAEGGVPNVLIQVPDRSEYTLGQLFYFFERACAMSGLLMGVNPFNQPGVENYKTKMFQLLGKPGYQK
ncbi:glucose-6-phosphate isomerase [Alicyclobacillus fastidiosus]|uniref:Glucose-6-phosphate isomerase n=1 Tax=Alicyclobacillus fastidiosus TaxID=392011 RepID=A0ABY6ZBT3_9BACL|nr:glucose-6-phosphate isomerase [Alicyclobacillus fastidiosus]WAH40317.1 glucose-6-phosphate isomerase [Alicyclobacillus fastidiosus]GMA61699.1 glucose-6-phosphate isomerase [Alicyclobacillus fastidiosus]